MVDFQSRDTRRGRDDGDDDDPETEDAPPEPGEDGRDDGTGHDAGDGTTDDHHAHDLDSLGVAVVTVSSSRSLSDDPSGDVVVAGLEAEGHRVVSRDLVADDFDGVQSSVNALVGRDDVDVVVTTGGTGVTPDDVTVEALEPLFDKELPGFGELFRLLSHDQIGTKVVGTRATAGVADGAVVFCLPGSEDAAKLGVEQIIVEEAEHLAGLAARGS